MTTNILNWLAEEYKTLIEMEWFVTMEDSSCVTDQKEFENNAYWHNISDNGSELCNYSFGGNWNEIFEDSDNPTMFDNWQDFLEILSAKERAQLRETLNNVVNEFLGKD